MTRVKMTNLQHTMWK